MIAYTGAGVGSFAVPVPIVKRHFDLREPRLHLDILSNGSTDWRGESDATLAQRRGISRQWLSKRALPILGTLRCRRAGSR